MVRILGLQRSYQDFNSRGLSYLALHQGTEYAGEFQKILDHRGIVVSDPCVITTCLPTRTKPLARRTLPRGWAASVQELADVVWVIGKGDSCDPITKNDAGRTPASQLF